MANPPTPVATEIWSWIVQNGAYFITLILALGLKDAKKALDYIQVVKTILEQILDKQKDHEERLRKLEQK